MQGPGSGGLLSRAPIVCHACGCLLTASFSHRFGREASGAPAAPVEETRELWHSELLYLSAVPCPPRARTER
jgi:hypothetical protein